MRKRSYTHHIDGLIALLLFGIFAVCVLAVLLTGADAYRRLTERDQASYDRRVCAQYVATRVRQADTQGGVILGDFEGTPALVLADGDFSTWVYFYDGYIRELYAFELDGLGPEAGDPVMEASGLEFSLEDGLLTAVVTDTGGERSTIVLSLRSGEGAAA